jgi:uncharacterized Zn finger protein
VRFGQLDLWRLAGKRSYERGEQYVDAVADLRHLTDGAVATVHGSEPYQVRLSWTTAGLTGDCSCPYAQEEGEFCKHCVAVGLVLIDAAEDDADDDAGPGDDALRAYLGSLEHAELVDLLCDQAALDDGLDRMLRLRASRDTARRTAH